MQKWYRSETNKKLGGVCGGLSEIFDIDVTILRFIFFWFIFITPLNLAYVVAWMIVPKKGDLHDTPTCSCCGATKASQETTSTGETANTASTQEFLAG